MKKVLSLALSLFLTLALIVMPNANKTEVNAQTVLAKKDYAYFYSDFSTSDATAFNSGVASLDAEGNSFVPVTANSAYGAKITSSLVTLKDADNKDVTLLKLEGSVNPDEKYSILNRYNLIFTDEKGQPFVMDNNSKYLIECKLFFESDSTWIKVNLGRGGLQSITDLSTGKVTKADASDLANVSGTHSYTTNSIPWGETNSFSAFSETTMPHSWYFPNGTSYRFLSWGNPRVATNWYDYPILMSDMCLQTSEFDVENNQITVTNDAETYDYTYGNYLSLFSNMERNSTLYIDYIKVKKEVTTTFNANGGKVNGEDSITLTAWGGDKLPVAEKEGFSFGGWYADESFTIPVGENYNSLTENATVYAKWNDKGEEDMIKAGFYPANSFVIGEKIASIDFSEMPTGTFTGNDTWQATKAYVVASKNGTGNVLNLNNEYGSTYLRTKVDAKNYVFVAKLATDGTNTTADGWTRLGITRHDASVTEPSLDVAFGYAQQNRPATATPKPNQYFLANGFYKTIGNGFNYDTNKYTEMTLTVYCYNDVYYFYANGEYLDMEANCVNSNKGADTYAYILDQWTSSAFVHSAEIYEISKLSVELTNAAFTYNEQAGVDLYFDIDKSEIADLKDTQFGAIITRQTSSVPTLTNKNSLNAEIITFDTNEEQNVYKIKHSIVLDATDNDKYINVRPYMTVNGIYYFGEAKAYATYNLASQFVKNTNPDNIDDIDAFFNGVSKYKGANSKSITFTAFSDFHYFNSRPNYTNAADLETIMKRAEENGSAFVLQSGDFCQEVSASPELYNIYQNYKKQNGETMLTYGVYGNHEMEMGGTLAIVTPTLTNDENAVWNTKDGKISADGSKPYYYVDKDGFRFIFLDNNYSFNPTTNEWEHNRAWSYGPPSGNTHIYSLGAEQTKWVTDVLTDAGENGLTCIVTSHVNYNKNFAEAGYETADEMTDLFNYINAKYPGTIVAQIGGHSHSARAEMKDNILYIALNHVYGNLDSKVSLNSHNTHYTEEHTRTKDFYDDAGNYTETKEVVIGELVIKNGNYYYYTEEPLSSTITIDENGTIIVDGYESEWIYDIQPDESVIEGYPYKYRDYMVPSNASFVNVDCDINGHYDAENDGVCDVCDEKLNGEVIAGDVDGNGAVNAADLATLKKVLAELIPLDSEEVKYPDVDSSGGTPNAADLALLKKKIANLL